MLHEYTTPLWTRLNLYQRDPLFKKKVALNPTTFSGELEFHIIKVPCVSKPCP
jgi:hypothetical protein